MEFLLELVHSLPQTFQLLLVGVVPVSHVSEAPKLGNTFIHLSGFCDGDYLLNHPALLLSELLKVVGILGHLPSQVGQIHTGVPGVLQWANRLEGLRSQRTLSQSGGL